MQAEQVVHGEQVAVLEVEVAAEVVVEAAEVEAVVVEEAQVTMVDVTVMIEIMRTMIVKNIIARQFTNLLRHLGTS